MTEQECLSKMVAPGTYRPSAWRGGIIQIHVTRACDLDCFGCTQGSNLRGKPVVIPVDEFEKACKSLQGYTGVVGVFGGNPAVHPQFEELCLILAEYFPKEQRGLWCNHPRGHGETMRLIFNPHVSNLNVHLCQEAYDEFKRDWPESKPFGIDQPSVPLNLRKDSRHSPPFVAMMDVIPNEGTRWALISNCDINKFWSAMVCYVPGKGLRGFFCEVAGAQAMLHANDPNWPDTGVVVDRDYEVTTRQGDYTNRGKWWQLPMTSFKNQVAFHCHRCGIPLRRYGQLAQGGEYEEVSATHADVYLPKDKARPVQLVQLDEGKHLGRVTDYAQNANV